MKLRAGKQLYAGWERKKRDKAGREAIKNGKLRKLGEFSGGGSQQLGLEAAQAILGTAGDEELQEVEDEDPYEKALEEGCDNMTQLRQSGTSGQDKFRISVEMVQLTFGLLGKWGVEPQSKHGKADVIYPGTHADAQNISPQLEDGSGGLFITSEHFSYKGKEVHREAGKGAGRLMSTVRKIRDKGDALSARLTKVANWYQQPNAVADKIIVSWQVKHTGEKYETSVCLRDLLRRLSQENPLGSV